MHALVPRRLCYIAYDRQKLVMPWKNGRRCCYKNSTKSKGADGKKRMNSSTVCAKEQHPLRQQGRVDALISTHAYFCRCTHLPDLSSRTRSVPVRGLDSGTSSTQHRSAINLGRERGNTNKAYYLEKIHTHTQTHQYHITVGPSLNTHTHRAIKNPGWRLSGSQRIKRHWSTVSIRRTFIVLFYGVGIGEWVDEKERSEVNLKI